MDQKFFVRHHNFEGEINELDFPGPIGDFDWLVHFLRVDQGSRLLAFEAKHPSGFFLRHKNFRIVLEPPDGTELFKQDHAFREVAPLAGDPRDGWHSYQAFQDKFKTRFLAHENLHLFLRDKSESGIAAGDASFRLIET
ncbi:AbfB domain-containing protein [Streptomyces diastatochromogenes]